MEPRIQHAQTADGVSIADWALGEGTRLMQPIIRYAVLRERLGRRLE